MNALFVKMTTDYTFLEKSHLFFMSSLLPNIIQILSFLTNCKLINVAEHFFNLFIALFFYYI